MIQPNELRLGNLAVVQGQIVEVNRGLLWQLLESNGFEELEPIPITPKVLIKCGAESEDESRMWWEIDLKQNIGQIHINPSMGMVWLKHHRKPGASLNPTSTDYLHQLQNLYYALTGEELYIKL